MTTKNKYEVYNGEMDGNAIWYYYKYAKSAFKRLQKCLKANNQSELTVII